MIIAAGLLKTILIISLCIGIFLPRFSLLILVALLWYFM
jgi:hypothetical protein